MTEREHWEAVYGSKRPSELSWFQHSVEPSLRMIERAQAKPESRIIDVGGGASTLVDSLLARGFASVAVLDVAAAALEASRARLGERAETVQWIAADVTRWTPTGVFDLWHDRAVFHFLTETEQRVAYKAALSKALAPGGWLVVATFAPEGPERCSGLPVQRWSASGLSEEFGAEFNLVESTQEDHRTPWGSAQAFTWALFRRRRP